ncbi:MAG: polysaccharide deacetylase family protein [Thermodesulfobacteriota bacterium]|nr:polysaccharide deacetylase family protein [Thermodesulfobacteriota bacterium]
MQQFVNRRKTIFGIIFILSLLLLAACATSTRSRHKTSEIRINDDFIIVKATAKDTLSSLAAEYLNDPSKGWLIAEFNHIKSLTSGQELCIPLFPFNKGGLKSGGFQTVPVLAYYSFSKNKPSKISITQDDFKAQMKYLKENGYHVITLDQLLGFFEYQEQIPEKSVAITFDDGWISVYDIAFPILKEYGFPATIFIYTDFIGGGKAMSWKQIKELSEAGFDIQCQTKTHRNLTVLKKKESFKEYFKSLEMEISYPKKLFKKKLNKECKCLAYPYGLTNNLVIAMLKKHGYRAAFTVDKKFNPFFIDKYKIHRSAIYGKYNIEKFKNKLSVFQNMELK